MEGLSAVNADAIRSTSDAAVVNAAAIGSLARANNAAQQAQSKSFIDAVTENTWINIIALGVAAYGIWKGAR